MNMEATTNPILRPWIALESTGVQSTAYADVARTDLHALFGHQPKRILDIGCATGAVGMGVKNNFADVYVLGCELDEQAATIARTRLDEVRLTPVREWSHEEQEVIPTMDTVLLLDVLEHMYNPWEELNFLAKHLTHQAQVIVSLPNMGHISSFMQLYRGYWHYEPAGIRDITHLRFFTEYEMKRMFYQTGYKIEVQEYLAVPAGLQTFDKYPIQVNFQSDMSMTVRSEEHWKSLYAIQLGFHLRVASDDELTEDELQLRYGAHD